MSRCWQVGLKYAGFVTCTRVITSEAGEAVELEATFSLEARTNVKGHIHWVCGASASSAPERATVRLYAPLFNEEMEMTEGSLQIVDGAVVDASLAAASPWSRFQFERVRKICVVFVFACN